jgi:hypothetical protein
VLWCPLRFPHANDVRFVFTSSCSQEGSGLIYLICACLYIVMSNTYCILCCQFLSEIVHFWVTLRYSLTFIIIVNLQYLWYNDYKIVICSFFTNHTACWSRQSGHHHHLIEMLLVLSLVFVHRKQCWLCVKQLSPTLHQKWK